MKSFRKPVLYQDQKILIHNHADFFRSTQNYELSNLWNETALCVY